MPGAAGCSTSAPGRGTARRSPPSVFPSGCFRKSAKPTILSARWHRRWPRRPGCPRERRVFAPIGDHQASFLGSLRDLHRDVLVNVGTGAQVAVYTEGWRFAAPVELRPLPLRHNLLSNVGLAGGWSYQILENFFRRISSDVFGLESDKPAYETLNRLAAAVPPGCDGLVCDPHFSGSRADPTQRGAFAGVTPQNMTPGHFARAVLEGMARSLADGLRYMVGFGKPAAWSHRGGRQRSPRECRPPRQRPRCVRASPVFHASSRGGGFWRGPHRRRRGRPVFFAGGGGSSD